MRVIVYGRAGDGCESLAAQIREDNPEATVSTCLLASAEPTANEVRAQLKLDDLSPSTVFVPAPILAVTNCRGLMATSY